MLKFNPRPDGLTHEEFKHVKQRIIEAAIEADCELFISCILHDIATSPAEARRNEINRVIYHFNCAVNIRKDVGLVLLDRFNDPKIDGHVKEKFAIGLTNMPYSKTMSLDRILGIHFSAVGQSNFPSVFDIIIGSLRFCINEHTRKDKDANESCGIILELLAPLFPKNDKGLVLERNLFFSPKAIKIDSYRQIYQSLSDFLASFDICPAQKITSMRNY